MVSVGKRAGRPSARQEHVSRLLVDYAATGANVVRLKSGDAGVFGRLKRRSRRSARLVSAMRSFRASRLPMPRPRRPDCH